MLATKEQIRQFYSILATLKLQDMKDDLVYDISTGRTTHASELYESELRVLIDTLNTKANAARSTINDQLKLKSDTMRKRILCICHQMAWTTWNKEKQKHVVDFPRLEAWLLKYGYLHKKLNDYKYNELQQLVHQFETMFKNYLERI